MRQVSTSHWLLITSAAFLLVNIEHVTTLNPKVFVEELNKLANDDLGVNRMQNHLDNEVRFQDAPLDGSKLIQQLSESLRTKFHERMQVVEQLRSVIEKEYSDMAAAGSMPTCCQTQGQEFDSRFKTKVDLRQACIVGVDTGTRLNNAVVAEMRSLLQNWPTIKWSYFGSEEGTMTVFPGSNNCPGSNFDPRYRPWYVETATPTPKDIVLVIDRSGSMRETYGGRTRLSLAQEAANTVINGLNPNDRVNIVMFSSDQQTPPGNARVGTCFSTQLALATPRNKQYLTEYVNGMHADGGTQYAPALKRAFTLLEKSFQSGSDRQMVILFLSDGEPTDDDDALDTLRTENAALDNKVIVLTYGMGADFAVGSSGRDILTRIAAQSKYDPAAGEIVPGLFTAVTDPNKLRTAMGSYYTFFSQGLAGGTSIMTTPYVDNFGIGLVTSVCLPVHHNHELVGVTCVDITMDDLLSDATYFEPGELSYAMMADGSGRTMMHPLLPRPYEVTEDPVFVHIDQLEQCSGVDQVINGMLSGEPGSRSMTCPRIRARGDGLHEGVDVSSVTATYYWEPIVGTNFSVCVVLAETDKQAQIVESADWPEDFFYHNLPLQDSLPTCGVFNRVAIKVGSVVKMSPQAFINPTRYMETAETKNDLDRYKNFMLGASEINPGFKEGIRATVTATVMADTIWRSRGEISHVAWRYLGTQNGVFRLYPGTMLARDFDHTQRPWYRRTIGQKGLFTLSVPYLDGFGAGVVVTLSKAIYEGKSGGQHSEQDLALGVMGMDFTLSHFYHSLLRLYPACAESGKRCFVMDNTGYLVVHKDFIETNPSSVPKYEYVHITEKEPQVARDLISQGVMKEEQCTNFQKIRQQNYWRVQLSGGVSSPTLEIDQIPGSNIFIGIIKTPGKGPFPCHCQESKGDTGACPTDDCRCPCYIDVVNSLYDTCNNRFLLASSEGSVSCTPQAPPLPVNRTAIEQEKAVVLTLDSCFDFDCSEQGTYESCTGIVTCVWCQYNPAHTLLDKAYCTVQEKCPFGTQVASVPVEKKGDGSGKLIAGIVVGVLVPVIIIVAVGVYLVKKRRLLSGGSGHDQGHSNAAMSNDIEFTRPPPTAPHHGELPPPYPGLS